MRMGVGERVAQGDADAHHVAIGQPAGGEQLVERRAVDQLGDQVGALVVDRRLVQSHDPGMGEPRGRPRLALEAPTATPNHARAGQDLDGDLAVQALVVGQPNRGEPTRAQAPAQAVAAEHERGVGRGTEIAGADPFRIALGRRPGLGPGRRIGARPG